MTTTTEKQKLEEFRAHKMRLHHLQMATLCMSGMLANLNPDGLQYIGQDEHSIESYESLS